MHRGRQIGRAVASHSGNDAYASNCIQRLWASTFSHALYAGLPPKGGVPQETAAPFKAAGKFAVTGEGFVTSARGGKAGVAGAYSLPGGLASRRPKYSQARLRLRAAVLWCGLVLASAPVVHATTPGDTCMSAQAELRGDVPAIERASSEAQALLKTGGSASADRALAKLVLPSDAGSAPLTMESRARYCIVAGEAMRTATSGSPYQAETYLLTAFRLSEQRGSAGLSARAAYQLGLLAPGGAGGNGVRGTQRGTRAAYVPSAQPFRLVRQDDEAACRQLAMPAFLTAASRMMTISALQCAGVRALGANDPVTASITKLKLMRYALTLAETSQDRAAFEGLARNWAEQGVGLVGRIADDEIRNELAERLTSGLIESSGGKISNSLSKQLLMLGASPAIGAGARANAAAVMARLALLGGDSGSALAWAQSAIFYENQRPSQTRLADWFVLLSDADPAQRLVHVTQAYQALEAVRPFLPLYDGLTGELNFTLRMKPVFELAVDMQLATNRRQDVQIATSQTIIETFRQAEVQNLLGDNCIPARVPLKASELRADELIIYPIILAHRVELLFAYGGQGAGGEAGHYERAATIAIERSEVSELARQFVDNTTIVNADADSTVRLKVSQRLYDLFIAPIASRLSQNTTLVIIPDSMLRGVPFAALADPDGKFLVEKTRLSIAPALAYSEPGEAGTGRKAVIVVAALQREMETPYGRFPRLEGVEPEAKAIVQASGSRGTFLPNFEKADLVRALSRRHLDVLHLATHASFNGGAERSFILTGSGALSLPELRQMLVQNHGRGAALDLLVLSACETAVGDEQASMGLAGAAVQAGARSALASLWQVNDLGTVKLMEQFYARYRAGASKADALRAAQLALIAQGGDTADPGIWAAFVLLGGWR